MDTHLFIDNVVIICPTYNRRKFLPILIYQFMYQTYPKDLLHMIILDDSDTSNHDIFDNLDNNIRSHITYKYIDKKQTIGKKRNILNKMAIDINANYIVCFDDDDYYPPNKIEYAIKQLKQSNYLICGSSEIPIYYTHLDSIYTIGPFNNKIYPGHACNGTLVYNIKYLDNHTYNNNDIKAEEIHFLNNYKINLLQLPYKHVILCIAHTNNTIDKQQLIICGNKLNITIKEYIQNNYLFNFYTNLIQSGEDILEDINIYKNI